MRKRHDQQYLIGGTVTLTGRFNSLSCSWVASCLSPSGPEKFSSDPLVFLGLPENSTFFFWVSVELSKVPPYAFSFISDFSYNIDSSSKTTSLLVKALLFSRFQSLKPLTPLVNPMKIYFLDLDSILILFWLSTKLYAGQPKIRKVE